MSFESTVANCSLDIVVPDTTVGFLGRDDDEKEWLTKLKSENVERKLTFFDEQLQFLLVLRLAHPEDVEPADAAHPPPYLLSFLAHTQVSYEASYISALSHAPPPAIRLNAPPRTTSSGLKPRGHLPPSIIPPATPNPMPATAENDRRYMRSEGTPLTSGVWGESASDDEPSFALLWDQELDVWTAVFRLRLNVAYFEMPYRDPLLCITAHITVRDKPLPSTPARAPLDALIAAVGPLPSSPITPAPDAVTTKSETDAFQRFYSGLEEVDLLAGLAGAGSVEADAELALPSTRLGPETRQTEFALRPARKTKEEDTPPPTRAPPTIRKAFRRTLPAVSGLRLRRRTVLVPHVLADASAAAPDERAAGGAERTLVLCVEVEHLGEANVAFEIQAVRVHVGNEVDATAARVRLIGVQAVPLRLAPFEQHNLLYAVELLHAPLNDVVGGGTQQDPPALPVAIVVDGRPVDGTVYPTAVFASTWNTTLGLAPRRVRDSLATDSLPPGVRDVLPEPPSPFPAPRTATSTTFAGAAPPAPPASQSLLAAAAARRLSAPALSSTRPPLRPQPARASTGPGLPPLREQPGPSSRTPYSPTPPSVAVAAYARTPLATTFAPAMMPPSTPATTFAPPTPQGHGLGFGLGVPPPASLAGILPAGETDEPFVTSPPPVPRTPAYPAYAPQSPLPDSPRTAAPFAAPRVGPAVDVPRGAPAPGPAPLSPAPPTDAAEDAVVVSVGLAEDGEESGNRIRPHDAFALDVFVFNRSRWTRRLEIGVPPRARRRREGGGEASEGPGIVALENRVRIGPLRPSTCQSVRMPFLALRAGVHTVDALVLTDVETGRAMTLRGVADVVVHEA
ncbi:TRAPP trafficking subunit Trs65-domain-containing protein [Vararia minispora EC-137]|uniref:TRAPP trafficking subunit Trs65-domain-containing protein n=1 Tax=Vararia minispora EC-137 TaxID=1314806 RepID=A0ACB8QTR7_9AGAM|nr:TRAPP trafficking subunit Trs65-domain-containing protein [Vararia minispora EC-137]